METGSEGPRFIPPSSNRSHQTGESRPPAPFSASQRVQNPPWPRPRSPGGGSGLSPQRRQFRCLIVPGGLGSRSGGSGVAVGLGNSGGKWEKDFEAV